MVVKVKETPRCGRNWESGTGHLHRCGFRRNHNQTWCRCDCFRSTRIPHLVLCCS